MNYKIFVKTVLYDKISVDCKIDKNIHKSMNKKVISSDYVAVISISISGFVERKEVTSVSMSKIKKGYQFYVALYNHCLVIIEMIETMSRKKCQWVNIIESLNHFGLLNTVGLKED